MSEATRETGGELGIADIQTLLSCCRTATRSCLVNRVVEINGDKSGVGIKNVTVNEPQFTGHSRTGRCFPACS